MLRRQYKEIGKRGIGVGYPSGINLTFDAGKMSLGSIWKGDFAEMSAVWRGQGSGFVKEAGEGLVTMGPGPSFAKLNAGEAPWPVIPKEEDAPEFQLLGYTLDEKQRPTFRYRFEEVQIEDFFEDFVEGPRLERTLTFSEAWPEGVYFRVAKTDQKKGFAKEGESWSLGNGLLLTSSAPVMVVPVEEGQELRISLKGLQELKLNYHYTES